MSDLSKMIVIIVGSVFVVLILKKFFARLDPYVEDDSAKPKKEKSE